MILRFHLASPRSECENRFHASQLHVMSTGWKIVMGFSKTIRNVRCPSCA